MINEYCAKCFCCEDIKKIENYNYAILDDTQTWHCHHRLEIQGPFKNSRKLLIKCKIYFKVPASQLIFLTPKEHIKLHHKGKKLSNETKLKLHMINLGENHPNFGKKRSKAFIQKMKKWHKHHKHPMLNKHQSNAAKHKISESSKNRRWWNNGKVCVFTKNCPEGFIAGRLKR